MVTRRTKITIKPRTDGWVESFEFEWNGRKIQPGTELSIEGQRGRFKFIKHVKTSKAEWIDVVGGKRDFTRSFRPDKIKTVHRLTKMQSRR